MEFKIVGILVWLVMCVVVFVYSLSQLGLPSNTDLATGVGGIVFIILANLFLLRNYITKGKKGETKG